MVERINIKKKKVTCVKCLLKGLAQRMCSTDVSSCVSICRLAGRICKELIIINTVAIYSAGLKFHSKIIR